jgi:hypothetical protein
MSDTLVFSGVSLKGFARTAKAGHAAFASSYPTKKICDEMGWGGMPEGVLSQKMEGELHASHMVLEPKEDGLKKHRVKMDVTGITGFQGFRLETEGSRGKGHRLEMRFNVGFVAAEACKDLERFLMTCGEAKCSLTVSYVKQSEMALTEGQEAALPEHDEEFK